MGLDLDRDESGDGPPVMILHGLFGSRSNWRGIARHLARSHRVIVPDLRNHGASAWDDTMDYPSMASDLARLMDSLDLTEPTVIGHSMGGKAAMALALAAPGRVARLIVVDVAPVRYPDRMSPFVDAMRSVDAGSATDRAEVQRRLTAAVPEPAVVPFLMQNLVSRDGALAWRLNLAAIGAAIGEISAFPDDLRDRRFDGPVRVIAGGRSDYVRHRDGAEFLPMFPRVRVDVVPYAGHWVHADAPQAMLDIVREELAAPA